MTHRSRLRAAIVAFVSLAPVLAVPSAIAGSASVSIATSTARTTYGDTVTLSGTVTGDPACSERRTIQLQWRAADSSGFATVDQGTTTATGTYAFDQSQPHTGRFRAFLPEDGGCEQTVSEEVLVRVRVFIDASIVAGSTEAGSCIDVFAIVSPAKPGRTVELQRRRGGSWATLQTLPLNGDSEARAEPCLGWEDIGVVRYRVRWAAQDTLNETASSPVLAFEVVRAAWMDRIEEIVGRRAVSVSVAEEDAYLYRRADLVPRTPASNEKLLLAMALLDTFGPDHRIATRAAAKVVDGTTVRGDLWLLGRGDPLVRRSSLGTLADNVAASGVQRIDGSVMGSTAYFRQDWDAPGWNAVARDYVNRPTALTFEGNDRPDPEREAAAALTRQLEKRGVRVRGRAGSGDPPADLHVVASAESKPMTVLLTKMLRPSWNFGAEVLGKGLGAEIRGVPGTIAKSAAAIEAWARSRGVEFRLFDSSGLSYANRVTAAGIVELLGQAEDEAWGDELRAALPTGGQGTLEDRLHHVRVRAKTGSLEEVSTLSGWVFSDRRDAWIEFSILCVGMPKSTASAIEDRIVRILQNLAG